MDSLSPLSVRAKCLAWLAVVWVSGLQLSLGVVLYDSGNPLENTSAPTGIYADSGWAYQGQYGGFLGTMIAPQYFITAQHFGTQGSTFVSTATLNGTADVTYTIDSAANGGQGYWDISGTDLRVLKINESFSSYAPIYTGSAEAGSTLVVFGRGGPRGAEVQLSSVTHGWAHTGSDGVVRWGANTVENYLQPSPVGNLLVAGFDAISGLQEATLSPGDSGGGMFINISGQWFLAGINYGVDGFFDTNNTLGDESSFGAALFDKGGFYEGNDADGWFFRTDTATDKPAKLYASRLSDSAFEITTITGVPEPGSLGLLMTASLLLLKRRRLSV